jgi:hypothetical protein
MKDSSANSGHSPCSSKAKLIDVEVSDHHISKEDSVESGRDQLESKLLEAKYFTDEDPVLVPADVPGVVHSSQQEPFRINKFRYGSR